MIAASVACFVIAYSDSHWGCMVPFFFYSMHVAGWAASISLFFAEGNEETQGCYLSSAKLTDGFGYCFGVILGGFNFVLFLLSSELQKSFPGYPFVGGLIFALVSIPFFVKGLQEEQK